jgi:dTDP-4-amino-4,6-dideoxygalactose transaminase
LESLPHISRPAIRNNTVHARHLYTIQINGKSRDAFVDEMQKAGIGVVINYRPVHLTQYFRTTYNYQSGAFPQAEMIGDTTVSLPFYPRMTDKNVETVVATVKQVLDKI